MKKYYLVCDGCGNTVDKLYTVNFNATDDSDGGNFYLPELEFCENCIDEICDVIKDLYDDREHYEKCDDHDDCVDYPIFNNHNSNIKDSYVPDLEDCTNLEKGEMPNEKTITDNDLVNEVDNLLNIFKKHSDDINNKVIVLDNVNDNKYKENQKCSDDVISEETKKAILDKIEYYYTNDDFDLTDGVKDISEWINTLSEAEKEFAICAAFEKALEYVLL